MTRTNWTQRPGVGGGRLIGEACHGIDLATFLVGSVPTRVYAAAVANAAGTDDECFITLHHECGGVSSIAYLAGGDRALAKERVEVIGGGRAAIIDDFRALTTYAEGKTERQRRRGQDKGHAAAFDAFERYLFGEAEAPIPWAELRAVSRATILAVASLRSGAPQDV